MIDRALRQHIGPKPPSARKKQRGLYLRSLPKRSSISWMGTSRGRFFTYSVELGGVRVAIFLSSYPFDCLCDCANLITI
jgi:hypothetical protein